MIVLMIAFILLGLSFALFPDLWGKVRSNAVTHRPDQVAIYRNGQRVWGVIVMTIGVLGLVAWLIWGGNLS